MAQTPVQNKLRLEGRQPISIEAFGEISSRAGRVVDRVRQAMLAPTASKQPPVLQSTQLATLTGLDLRQVDYRAKRGDLPSGTMVSKRRQFTLHEAF